MPREHSIIPHGQSPHHRPGRPLEPGCLRAPPTSPAPCGAGDSLSHFCSLQPHFAAPAGMRGGGVRGSGMGPSGPPPSPRGAVEAVRRLLREPVCGFRLEAGAPGAGQGPGGWRGAAARGAPGGTALEGAAIPAIAPVTAAGSSGKRRRPRGRVAAGHACATLVINAPSSAPPKKATAEAPSRTCGSDLPRRIPRARTRAGASSCPVRRDLVGGARCWGEWMMSRSKGAVSLFEDCV